LYAVSKRHILYSADLGFIGIWGFEHIPAYAVTISVDVFAVGVRWGILVAMLLHLLGNEPVRLDC